MHLEIYTLIAVCVMCFLGGGIAQTLFDLYLVDRLEKVVKECLQDEKAESD